MSKLYEIEITITAVVCADSEEDAYMVAQDQSSEIVRDDPKDMVAIIRQVKYADQLPEGWDVECIPYGGNGDEIGEYLHERPPARDTKTIDMFGAQA